MFLYVNADYLSVYIDFRIYFTNQNSLDWSWSPLSSVPSVDPLDFFLNYPAMAYRKVPAENNLALIHKCTILICYSWLQVYFIGEIGTGAGVTWKIWSGKESTQTIKTVFADFDSPGMRYMDHGGFCCVLSPTCRSIAICQKRWIRTAI